MLGDGLEASFGRKDHHWKYGVPGYSRARSSRLGIQAVAPRDRLDRKPSRLGRKNAITLRLCSLFTSVTALPAAAPARKVSGQQLVATIVEYRYEEFSDL